MAELRAATEGRSIGITRAALAEFLVPGWSPCLSSKQPTYPPTECGLLAGLAQPSVVRAAAAAQAAAYAGTNAAFFWEW